MGLFDSLLGAVMNNNNAQAEGGGLGGLVGMLTSNPQLMQAVAGMLGNDGAHGGLDGLVAKFKDAGMGNIVDSWIGSGQNQPISADQISNVLGSDVISGMAQKLGLDTQEVASQLSAVLPGLVDKFTPAGAAPASGLGNANDLFGMLGSLMKS